MKRKIISIFVMLMMLIQSISVMAYSESEAINMLDFTDISFELQEQVTLDLGLVYTFKGHNVTWESSDEAVITSDGKVKRPAVGENPVSATLTATIGSQSKPFPITVLPYTSASEVITLAKSKLTFNKLSTESIDGVTTALMLPATDEYGTIIRWESSDNRVLKIVPDGDDFKGEINRASYSDGNFSVFLTASLFYGDAFEQTRFYITISEMDVSYHYSTAMVSIIDTFNNAFTMANNIHAVRNNLVLPTVSGAKITYTSSNPAVIANDGTVTRPVKSDETVFFIATLENGYENTHITYSLIVKPVGADETADRLEEDLEWVIAQISSTNLGAVTTNLTLPTKAPNGSNISYESSNPTVLATNGAVTRPVADTDVILKVKVYFADEYREETVTVKVKGATAIGGLPVDIGGGTSPAGPSAGGPVTPVPEVTPVAPKYTYSDVTPAHWAYSAIEDLTKRGIVNGNDDGTFGPNDFITREAFVKMLVTAMDAQIDWYKTPFGDVKDSAWYYNYVATAVNAGIVNGIEDNFFGIGYNITRQDICVLIYRAFYAGETADDADCNDFGEVSDYAKTAVSVMYKNGILQGDDDGNFNPKQSATRAEVAAIFSRLLNK